MRDAHILSALGIDEIYFLFYEVSIILFQYGESP